MIRALARLACFFSLFFPHLDWTTSPPSEQEFSLHQSLVLLCFHCEKTEWNVLVTSTGLDWMTAASVGTAGAKRVTKSVSPPKLHVHFALSIFFFFCQIVIQSIWTLWQHIFSHISLSFETPSLAGDKKLWEDAPTSNAALLRIFQMVKRNIW